MAGQFVGFSRHLALERSDIVCRSMYGVVLGAAARPMRRREFITLFGGVTASLSPLAAPAQQPATGKWRMGMLVPGDRHKFILEGLRTLGYIEGQNILVERRFDDKAEGRPAFASELRTRRPAITL